LNRYAYFYAAWRDFVLGKISLELYMQIWDENQNYPLFFAKEDPFFVFSSLEKKKLWEKIYVFDSELKIFFPSDFVQRHLDSKSVLFC
jgi:hypothetical protein